MAAGTYTCPFGDGCTSPLEFTTAAIYDHLRVHGHVYSHRGRAPCPWLGCSKEMRWGNVARHIIERHGAYEYLRGNPLSVSDPYCALPTSPRRRVCIYILDALSAIAWFGFVTRREKNRINFHCPWVVDIVGVRASV